MTDRELLEAAARAAGLEGYEYMKADQGGYECMAFDPGGSKSHYWNPLAGDGDALRLAVQLGMRVGSRQVDWVGGEYIGIFIEDKEEPDDLAATRRAIVQAAAEFGRQYADTAR